MKDKWLIWFAIFGIIVMSLIILNYEGSDSDVPLSEIFPETGSGQPVEYVYVDSQTQKEELLSKPKPTPVPMEKPQRILDAQNVQKQVAAKPKSAPKPKAVSQPRPSTTTVKKTAATPKSSPQVSSQGKYTVQVASYKNKLTAERALKKMTEKKLPAFIARVDLGAKGTWFRIYMGRYATKAQAQDFLRTVKSSYPGSFIISIK